MAKKVGTITSGAAEYSGPVDPPRAATSAAALAAQAPAEVRGLTPAEEYTLRYTRTERESDALGRVIVVRRLKPSQEVHLRALAGTDDEAIFQPLFVAASVVSLDGAPMTFPKSRAELDAVLDALDKEGLNAGIVALMRLRGVASPTADVRADAKN